MVAGAMPDSLSIAWQETSSGAPPMICWSSRNRLGSARTLAIRWNSWSVMPKVSHMSLTRRSFMHALGAGAASSLVPTLHLPELEWVNAPAGAVRLDRNENPNGPAKEAIQAITLAAAESSRYPDELVMQLTRSVADAVGVAEFNVVLTCGSTDVIRSSVYSFTSPTRALVTAAPSYESPGNDALRIKSAVVAVPVTADLALDLPKIAAASKGAGL